MAGDGLEKQLQSDAGRQIFGGAGEMRILQLGLVYSSNLETEIRI